MKAFAKLTQRGRRRAAHHLRPAADRADRTNSPATGPRGDHGRADRSSSAATGGRCSRIAGRCSRATASSTSRARWSASAASARAAGSCCCSGATTAIRSSSRSRRRRPSVLEPVLGRSQYRNHGQRVVEGQRLMQAASDIFLGWIHVESRARRAAARLLRPPALGLEDLGRPRHDPAAGARALRAGVRRGRSRARTRARATASRSRRISARTTSSTARSRSSRSRTPTRTSATTTRSCKPLATAGSRRKEGI